MESRTRYSAEYRRETADYIIASGKPVAAMCKELGINQKTGARWVADRKAELSGEKPTAEKSAQTLALQKRIKELEMENAFLKKAAAFFAKDQA